MSKLLIIILIISIIGNFIGLFILYKYFGVKRYIENVKNDYSKHLEKLTDILDNKYPKKMVFLHHSVGSGILYEGGLQDSLLEMNILVKSSTYGSEIGEHTDMCYWLPKFQNDMDKIIKFKSHPNKYYTDGSSNDIVMFKSCFPNSFIAGEGHEPGNPLSNERTIANYKAVFNQLRNEIAKNNDKLFIYLTAPPLVSDGKSFQEANRAREFNNWLINDFLPDYKKSTGFDNFAIFDLFNALAGSDNFLKAEYCVNRKGDSHPNTKANKEVAAKFMQFFRPVWGKWQNRDEAHQ
ncbi:MAG: hypothetical protein J7K40_06885 [candidate division Zixibacteria bacterium]|nr:hypothetical protein [candidate division Zixibacteria bacterium]